MRSSAATAPARCRMQSSRRCSHSAEMRSACVLGLLLVSTVAHSTAALEPSAVRAAAAYSTSHRGASLLVIHQGRTLLEEYPDGGGAGVARKIYSGTKAFWNLAALAAAQDGILSLDERVADTIPEWRNDARKSRVTIRQLLDFSADRKSVV